VKENGTEIVIYLEEKNPVPNEYSNVKVESKRIYDSVVAQNFIVLDKKLFLNIRHRRWIVKDEVYLLHSELYTILINKEKRG
jgi:hypothetical protein